MRKSLKPGDLVWCMKSLPIGSVQTNVLGEPIKGMVVYGKDHGELVGILANDLRNQCRVTYWHHTRLKKIVK